MRCSYRRSAVFELSNVFFQNEYLRSELSKLHEIVDYGSHKTMKAENQKFGSIKIKLNQNFSIFYLVEQQSNFEHLLRSQNSVIERLRHECEELTTKLERIGRLKKR